VEIVTELQRYLAEEIAEDYADRIVTRREALRKLALLGVGAATATSLLAGVARVSTAVAAPAGARAAGPAPLPTRPITFRGPQGRRLLGAWAAARRPRGAVLVIHENRGLTPHIRSVAGRLAASGYSALAIDLLSEEGGTGAFPSEDEARAALAAVPEARLVADLKAGVTELRRRLPREQLAAMGFCFGGAMTWRLLTAKEPRLAAAAPFYGPFPDGGNLTGSKAAVLAFYGGLDARVNASRSAARGALQRARLKHEIVTYPNADHAFFNDTGPRYDPAAAAAAYRRLLAWFGRHLS
jgi:carboxymethylenebutenolidase